jgi:hypothetical protein
MPCDVAHMVTAQRAGAVRNCRRLGLQAWLTACLRALSRLRGTWLVALMPSVFSALGLACPSYATAEASWSFAPAQAPPAPAGVASAPYGVPVGAVGEISFWAPNRGVLITGGTESAGGPVSAGVYAYNGVSWHQLATECGSAEGRVVWAGPDEFWTISDQRAGQLIASSGEQFEAPAVSLCRFANGAIAASYAVALEAPGS